MADWKKLAKEALLADGKIDTREVEILRRSLFADARIDKSELEFLADLRKSAKSTVKEFMKLFIEAVKNHMLADGVITDTEAAWLRKTIFADKKVDADEIELLKELKRSAKKTSPEFDKLYNECVK
ncbi:MAG: hypothetical protein WHU94_00990 [Thermogemmata sp.]|jgi:uncharacterized tellurite resistance protein B-like protein|uniref:TerB family tellurite resistance protein n=1 Tax=Thermogemmata fonticola TaxID=2755323 RepID=A0A7V9AAH7_9BACT|nr:TerB family tellurite resistance protein [Thermogemmata fonticola]MBA2225126.1 TerB family tellurite resistance protein [Thermogemmata fonticola]GIW84418.1 MAG: hypothetical protein KatS3mg107_0078 [Gemmataceae bacterium]